MSIRIDKITTGRFGNKLLQYNSLVQLGKKYNVKCSMVQNNEITYFYRILLFAICNFVYTFFASEKSLVFIILIVLESFREIRLS